jgi:DNA invertase Pin-like site-specific DNA recombinase
MFWMRRNRTRKSGDQAATQRGVKFKGVKRGPGRPRRQINAEQVRKLAALGCSYREIANFFECNVSTIQRNFAQAGDQG